MCRAFFVHAVQFAMRDGNIVSVNNDCGNYSDHNNDYITMLELGLVLHTPIIKLNY